MSKPGSLFHETTGRLTVPMHPMSGLLAEAPGDPVARYLREWWRRRLALKAAEYFAGFGKSTRSGNVSIPSTRSRELDK